MGRNSHCRSRNRARSAKGSESTGVRQQQNYRNVNRDSTSIVAVACRFADGVKFIAGLLILTSVRTIVSWSTSACSRVLSTVRDIVMSLECCGKWFSTDSPDTQPVLLHVEQRSIDLLDSSLIIETGTNGEPQLHDDLMHAPVHNERNQTSKSNSNVCDPSLSQNSMKVDMNPEHHGNDHQTDGMDTLSVSGSVAELIVSDKPKKKEKSGAERGSSQPSAVVGSKSKKRLKEKHKNDKHIVNNETPGDHPSSSTLESSTMKKREKKSSSKSKHDKMGVDCLGTVHEEGKTPLDNGEKKLRGELKESMTAEGSSNQHDTRQLPKNSEECSHTKTAQENNSSLNDSTVQGDANRPDDSETDVESRRQHENAEEAAKIDEIKNNDHQPASNQPGSMPNRQHSEEQYEEQTLEQPASDIEVGIKTDLPSGKTTKLKNKLHFKKKQGNYDITSHSDRMLEKIAKFEKQKGDEDKAKLISSEVLPDEQPQKRKRDPKDDTETEYGKARRTKTGSDDHATFRPVGLKNLGNTCYFNAVMQNMYQTLPLRESLSETKSKMKPLTMDLVKFYNQLDMHIQEGRFSEAFDPQDLLYSISLKSKRFQGRRQQDSHELLRHVMDGVKEEEKRYNMQKQETEVQQQGTLSSDPRLTVVDRVFGGHYLTVFYCKKNHAYHLFEPFLDVSLPVVDMQTCYEQQSRGWVESVQEPTPSNVPESGEKYMNALSELQKRLNDVKSRPPDQFHLLHCLRYFTRKEHLDEYLCLECNQDKPDAEYDLTSGTKQTVIYNPPAVLTIHLKRFEQTGQGYVKVNKRVTFGTQIDLAPFCSKYCKRQGGRDSIMYNLYGVVVHHGSLLKGHYTAYVRVQEHSNLENTKQFLQTEFLDREALMNKDKLIELLGNVPPASSRLNPTGNDESGSRSGWWFVSDDEVRQELVKDVLRQKAYLLFYERVL